MDINMITIDNDNNIVIPFDEKRLNYEFSYFLDKPGKLGGINKYNFIIKFFQQNIFYKKELELCNNEKIFNKIVNNRIKYLNKSIDELTSEDILQGFKRSGIYYGYGHFNPLLIKWFYERYNIKSCYDPCGGWGHRLLGSLDLDLYIYNDLSKTTFDNINRIVKYFNLECITKTYNNDASKFIPNDYFEAMFTCPPYFNLEHYECGDFKTINEYYNFIDSLFKVFYKKTSCNVFGLVLREDLLENKWKEISEEQYLLDIKKSSHITSGGNHKYKEYLYIFKKKKE